MAQTKTKDLCKFLAFLFIVFGLLQIILFFKIWGMTNDIAEIKKEFIKYLNKDEETVETSTFDMNNIISNGTLVVEIKTEKQMTFERLLPNHKYECSRNMIVIGSYEASDIMEYNKWVEKWPDIDKLI